MHPRDKRSGLPISRRELLLRSAGVMASLPAASALLAACQEPAGETPEEAGWELSSPDNPVTQPIHDGNEAIASDLALEQGAVLKILNWDAFLNRKVLEDFEKRFDCKVEVSTFGTGMRASRRCDRARGTGTSTSPRPTWSASSWRRT